MSINAGQIVAEALLDVSQTDAATAKLTANVQTVNKAFESIKTPKLALDTTQVDAKTKATAGSLNDLFGKLTGLPTGKVNLDVGQAEQGVASIKNTLQGLLGTVGVNTTALGGLSAVLGAGGLVAAAGAATVALGQLGAEFRSLDRALANTTGASGEALRALRSDFDALFRSVPADGGDIVKAQAIIFQEFRQTGESARALVADLNAFTRVIGGDLRENTRGAVDVFNAWQVATEDQAQTLRDLTRAIQFTGSDSRELFAELTRGSASFQALGLNIKESAVLLDALKDAGLPARAVFSSLREAMNNATKGGADTTDFFNDVTQSIKALDSETEAAALAASIFGEAFGPTLAKLIRSGRLELDEMVRAIDESGDPLSSNFARGTTAAGQFQLALNGLKKDLEPAGTAVLNFAATFGIGVVGSVNEARKSLEQFMNSGAVQAFLQLRETVTSAPGLDNLGANALALTPGAGGLVRGAQVAGAIAGAGRGAGQDLAQETQATNDLTDATEKAAKSHNDLATAQANVALGSKAAKEEVKSLAEQLRTAGDNTELIQSLLTAEAQVKDFDSAIQSLTDRTLAANLIAIRNQAEAMGQLTGDWSQYDAVVEDARTHMEAQRATQEAATTAQKEAAKAVSDIEAAMKKAASAGVDLYAERLNNLANAVLPNLDEATAVSLKQALLLGDQQAALGIIAAATGQSQQELAAGLHSTGTAAAEAAKQAAAASESFADILKDETRARLGSAITSLASATDALTASEAKHLEETGKSDQALQLLLEHAGAAPGAFAALKAGLLEGGAAAFEAREQIAALTTFVRDQGTVRLKVDVDIQAAETALAKLQADFREANTQRAAAETKATREFSEQQSALSKQHSDFRNASNAELLGINQARRESTTQLGADLAAVAQASTAAETSISATARKAGEAHRLTLQDASVGLTLAFTTATKTYQDGVRALREQAAQAVEAAANAAASGLHALSAAMTNFTQQQVQSAFTASVAREAAENAANGFTDFTSQQSARRALQIQAEGAAGIQQQQQANALAQAQHSIAQQQLDATKALNKGMADLAKAMDKLGEDQQKAQADARVAAGNASVAAERALRISQLGEDITNIETPLVRQVVIGPDGVPRVVDSLAQLSITDPMWAQLGITGPGGTAGQRNAALVAADKARSSAIDADNQRRKRLNDQEDENQRRFEAEAVRRAEETRKAQEAFEEAAKIRRAEQRKAEKDFEEQRHAAQVQLDILRELQGIRDHLDRPNVSIGPSTIQETSKDMLTKAREVATQRLRV